MRMPKRGEKGFTLIELLIVLAIMGVLAAVIVPSVRGVFGKGAEQAYDTDKKTLQTVVQTFFQETVTVIGRGAAPDSYTGHFYPTYKIDVQGATVSDGRVAVDDEPSVAADTAQGAIDGAFINMHLLVSMGLLSEIPESAAACNQYTGDTLDDDIVTLAEDADGITTADITGGTYGWYVDPDGDVASAPSFSDAGSVYP